jgi:hypothetical protein
MLAKDRAGDKLEGASEMIDAVVKNFASTNGYKSG